MSSIVPPVCSDDQIRRALVIARSDLNGIDYIDVDPTNHASLTLYFLKPVPPLDPANPNDTDDAYGLSGDLAKITFTGGTRIVGIQPAAASRKPDGSILVTASKPGDFSTYTIALGVPVLDPLFASIDFSFMASCPVAFDCRPVINCPPQLPGELTLDYEAKDYASFRQLLLDLLPQLNPNFTETNPSDLGIALVELQAYVGDRLSYFQDAVANEAYLDTLRQRISARRHARLIDYRMHDGRNAWACVHIAVNAAFTLPAGTALLSHIGAPLLGDTVAPGVVIDGSRINAVSLLSDPALDGVVVFETVAAAALDPANDAIFIHSWGNEECCLPGGATEAFLFALRADGKTALGHFLCETGRSARAGDDRGAAYEGAASLLALQQAPLLHVAQCVTHGDPAHPEHLAELGFVGKLCAVRPRSIGNQRAQGALRLMPEGLRPIAGGASDMERQIHGRGLVHSGWPRAARPAPTRLARVPK